MLMTAGLTSKAGELLIPVSGKESCEQWEFKASQFKPAEKREKVNQFPVSLGKMKLLLSLSYTRRAERYFGSEIIKMC